MAVEEDGAFRERWFEAGRVALVWIPADSEPCDEPDFEPERYDLPITWVRAGEEGIDLRRPSR